MTTHRWQLLVAMSAGAVIELAFTKPSRWNVFCAALGVMNMTMLLWGVW